MLELTELYTESETLAQVKKAFERNETFPNIKLAQFFEDPFELSDKLQLLSFKKDRDPLHHNYEKAKLPPELIALLQVSLVPLLKTFELTTLLQAEVYRLGHKSYSMLTDADTAQKSETVDIILDLSDEWDPGFGGDVVYANENGETLEIEPSPNTAIVVKCPKQTRSFIKYCNHYGKDYERLLIVLTFKHA